MNFKFESKIRNTKGIGMAEVLLGIALLSALTYGVLEIARSHLNLMARSNLASDLSRFEKEVHSLLSTPGGCSYELKKEKYLIPDSPKEEDFIEISKGAFVEESNYHRLILDSIRLESLSEVNPTTYESVLSFYISKKTYPKVALKPKRFPVTLNITSAIDREIILCESSIIENNNTLDLLNIVNTTEWIEEIGKNICTDYGLEYKDGECVMPVEKEHITNKETEVAYCYHESPTHYIEGEVYKDDPTPEDKTNGDEYFTAKVRGGKKIGSIDNCESGWRTTTSFNDAQHRIVDCGLGGDAQSSDEYVFIRTDDENDPKSIQVFIYDDFMDNGSNRHIDKSFINCVGSFQ